MVAQSSILQRLIQPAEGGLSEEHARYVLGLTFSDSDRLRFSELSQLARDGALTTESQRELDEYLEVNAWLTVLHSKARVSLRSGRDSA